MMIECGLPGVRGRKRRTAHRADGRGQRPRARCRWRRPPRHPPVHRSHRPAEAAGKAEEAAVARQPRRLGVARRSAGCRPVRWNVVQADQLERRDRQRQRRPATIKASSDGRGRVSGVPTPARARRSPPPKASERTTTSAWSQSKPLERPMIVRLDRRPLPAITTGRSQPLGPGRRQARSRAAPPIPASAAIAGASITR